MFKALRDLSQHMVSCVPLPWPWGSLSVITLASLCWVTPNHRSTHLTIRLALPDLVLSQCWVILMPEHNWGDSLHKKMQIKINNKWTCLLKRHFFFVPCRGELDLAAFKKPKVLCSCPHNAQETIWCQGWCLVLLRAEHALQPSELSPCAKDFYKAPNVVCWVPSLTLFPNSLTAWQSYLLKDAL